MKSTWRIFFIFFIGTGLAILAQGVASKGLMKFNAHRYPRLQEIFVNNAPYDVVFLGSSRTHTTIYPAIVDSVTGLSTYNAGTEGGVLPEFKMTLDGYLLHHPAPAMVVLTIDPGSFDISSQMFDPTQYLPFIRKNKYIEKSLANTDKKYTLVKYIPFIEFIYMDDYIKNNALRGFMGQTEILPGEFDNKGFLSNGTSCVSINNALPKTSNVNEEAIHVFKTMVDTCKKRNIKLVITYAPEYQYKYQEKFSNFKEVISIIENLTKTNNLPFYRDDSLDMAKNPCYFANYGHTNTRGAIVYSGILGQRIKGLLSSD